VYFLLICSRSGTSGINSPSPSTEECQSGALVFMTLTAETESFRKVPEREHISKIHNSQYSIIKEVLSGEELKKQHGQGILLFPYLYTDRKGRGKFISRNEITEEGFSRIGLPVSQLADEVNKESSAYLL